MGECVGLVGPNGSGKTTFLKGVLGFLPPQRGRLHLEASRRYAYVPQLDSLNLNWPLTAKEVVSLASRSKRIFGWLTSEEKSRIENAIEKAGIKGISGRLYSEMSGGQRQRAILAQALSQTPDILLLDEPTRGLDVVAEREFLDLIQKLRSEQKLTVLLVTHTLHIPINFSDKILLFKSGAVIETSPQELMKTNKLEEIYGIPFSHHEAEGIRWVSPK